MQTYLKKKTKIFICHRISLIVAVAENITLLVCFTFLGAQKMIFGSNRAEEGAVMELLINVCNVGAYGRLPLKTL